MNSTTSKQQSQYKKVIIIGGFGWHDIGDEAMPQTVILNLKREIKLPLEIVMISPDPTYTSTYHGVRAITDINFENCPKAIFKVLSKRGSVVFNLLKFLLITSIIQLYRFKITPPLKGKFKDIWNEISHAHLLFNCGGGNLNSLMRNEILKKAIIHKMAHVLGIPIIVSGQTIGPIYNRIDKFILKCFLNQAKIITLRDKTISAKRLANMNIKKPYILDTADDAISLPAISKKDALQIILNYAPISWNEVDGPIFSLNVKASLSMWHSQKENFNMKRAIELCSAFAEHLTARLNGRVMLVSTDYCPGSDDREILKEIYQRINSKNRVLFLADEFNDKEIKGIIALSDFCIGSRYHFEVFALSQFIPCIGIAAGEYQKTKIKGIHDLCGIPEYYIDTDLDKTELQSLIKTMDRLIDDKERIQSLLKKRIPKLISRSMITIKYARIILSAESY